MTSDLKAGILSTIFATWLHNNFAIGLIVAIMVVAVLMVFKPKRKLVFFLFGFLFLLLEFEYQKHFGKALEEQTVTSVVLQGGHLRTRSILEDFFQKFIPFFLWLGGWGLVLLGVIL